MSSQKTSSFEFQIFGKKFSKLRAKFGFYRPVRIPEPQLHERKPGLLRRLPLIEGEKLASPDGLRGSHLEGNFLSTEVMCLSIDHELAMTGQLQKLQTSSPQEAKKDVL